MAKSAGKPTSRPPPSTPSSLASRAAVGGSRGDARARRHFTPRRFDRHEVRHRDSMDAYFYPHSRLSSSSRASRRRHDASDGCARRIASRRGRRVRMTMVVIYAFTRRATPRARCARDDDGVARRKYIATRRVARPLAVVRARRAGRGRFRRWDTRRGDYIIPSPSSKASTTPRGWVMSQDSWIVDKTPRRRGETRTRDGVIRLIQGEARD